jgi:predicted dehydrogenase
MPGRTTGSIEDGPPGAIRVDDEMKTRDIRLAVVGYGYWGSKHVRVLSGLPNVQVTVVDVVPARLDNARTAHPRVITATALSQVLDQVDGVLVATPPASHAAVARLAVQAGKSVLVEKPLASTVRDAVELIELAARNRVSVTAGHTFEYNPAVRKLREIILSGQLGRILYIDSARLSLGLYQRDVNVIWDLAPHDVSILCYLLGEMPRTATAWAQRNVGGLHADVAYMRLDFPRSLVPAFVHVSWLNPCKVRRLTVVGDQKMAVYNDMSPNERIRIYDAGVDIPQADAAGSPLPVSYRTGDIVSPFIPFQEPLVLQDGQFVHSVRTGEPTDTPGERGLAVVRVLAAIDASQRSGRPVEIAPGTSPVSAVALDPAAV